MVLQRKQNKDIRFAPSRLPLTAAHTSTVAALSSRITVVPSTFSWNGHDKGASCSLLFPFSGRGCSAFRTGYGYTCSFSLPSFPYCFTRTQLFKLWHVFVDKKFYTFAKIRRHLLRRKKKQYCLSGDASYYFLTDTYIVDGACSYLVPVLGNEILITLAISCRGLHAYIHHSCSPEDRRIAVAFSLSSPLSV